jgi:hypothetical protein
MYVKDALNIVMNDTNRNILKIGGRNITRGRMVFYHKKYFTNFNPAQLVLYFKYWNANFMVVESDEAFVVYQIRNITEFLEDDNFVEDPRCTILCSPLLRPFIDEVRHPVAEFWSVPELSNIEKNHLMDAYEGSIKMYLQDINKTRYLILMSHKFRPGQYNMQVASDNNATPEAKMLAKIIDNIHMLRLVLSFCFFDPDA